MTTRAEARNLKIAARLTKNIYARVSKFIKPGFSETEIASMISRLTRERGLKRSFKTIVASGPNAADPHAKITKRRIRPNEMVVVDFGVIYKGCHSDMTRTVAVGKPRERMKKIYAAVKSAQDFAIRAVRPGLTISDFTKEVHGLLRKKGFGKYIMHNLGHGVGKRIHQSPKLSEKNNRTLKEGVVITIEPGLYVKGAGGVRIEDMVYLKHNGKEVLTR